MIWQQVTGITLPPALRREFLGRQATAHLCDGDSRVLESAARDVLAQHGELRLHVWLGEVRHRQPPSTSDASMRSIRSDEYEAHRSSTIHPQPVDGATHKKVSRILGEVGRPDRYL